MKSFFLRFLSFIFLQLAFAEAPLPLSERIKNLDDELIQIQQKIKEVEKIAGNIDERKALREEIAFKLPEYSYLIYEYAFEIEKPIDNLKIFNPKVRLNMIRETLSTLRPPETGLVQPEHPLAPLYGMRDDVSKTKKILLVQDYPLEKNSIFA